MYPLPSSNLRITTLVADIGEKIIHIGYADCIFQLYNSRKEIYTFLLEKLPDILTEGQKYNRIRNVLRK